MPTNTDGRVLASPVNQEVCLRGTQLDLQRAPGGCLDARHVGDVEQVGLQRVDVLADSHRGHLDTRPSARRVLSSSSWRSTSPGADCGVRAEHRRVDDLRRNADCGGGNHLRRDLVGPEQRHQLADHVVPVDAADTTHRHGHEGGARARGHQRQLGAVAAATPVPIRSAAQARTTAMPSSLAGSTAYALAATAAQSRASRSIWSRSAAVTTTPTGPFATPQNRPEQLLGPAARAARRLRQRIGAGGDATGALAATHAPISVGSALSTKSFTAAENGITALCGPSTPTVDQTVILPLRSR